MGSNEQRSHATRSKDTYFHNFKQPADFIANNYPKIIAHPQVRGGALKLPASPGMTHIDSNGNLKNTKEVIMVFEKDTGDVKTIYPHERKN